jgi:hypothetical protein
MPGITSIAARPMIPAPQGGAASSSFNNQSGTGFQLPAPTTPMSQSSAQGISSVVSLSLDSQTLSALLQVQDLNPAQGHGHGGGGGHNGGMKMMPNLAAEEAAESEEAQLVRGRKKFTKEVRLDNTSATAEVDENGVVVIRDVQKDDVDQPDKERRMNS